MKKFLLGRIGMADDPTSVRPSLHDCLEIVLAQSDALMGDVLDGLAVSAAKQKGTGAMGDHAPLNKAATEFLCNQSVAVKKTFKAQLRHGVYHSGAQDFEEHAQVRFEDLQLLDSRQIDANIEFAMAQQEVRRCVEDVLPGLDALVSTLLGWISVQPRLNPLKPDAFVSALQACLAQHAPDEAARVSLIKPAAGLLGVSLRQLYREVTDWLRSQGIEPVVPLGRPNLGQMARPKEAESSVARTMVTLDRLRKLLSGEFGNAAGPQDFLHTVPASLIGLEDMKLVEPMMRRLALRASRTSEPQAEVDLLGVGSEPAANQSSHLGKQLGEEVVRMMLDNLAQDKRLLPKVRDLIQTLEPLLLALADSDPRFFSDRQHPARQFLDRLTNRSLGFAAEADVGFSWFFKSISDAVVLLEGGEGDAAAFDQALRGLEISWAQGEEAHRKEHEEAARALLHVEQRYLLAQRLADDFLQRQRNTETPELIAVFLRGPWAQVVAEAQLSCNDGDTDPGGYMALVDELLWSVQVRLARRNRARLVQLVPHLLVKLRQGLQLIQYPAERIPVFFDALISIHEKAFEGPVVSAQAEFETPTTAAVDITPQVTSLSDWSDSIGATSLWPFDEEGAEVQELAVGAEPVDEAAQVPMSVGNFKTGLWVDLIVNGAWLRAQLTWASPHRTLFMFVSRGGMAHTMSRRSLERLRMQGRVRVVSDGHIVENALDAVAQTALQNEVGQVDSRP